MFDLSVVTPEKIFYEDKINSLVIPATLGYLGVLTNHAPLLTGLVPGRITIKDQQGKRRILAVSGGFTEVLKNRVTVLADAVEFPDKIDLERAQKALERSKQRLKSREKGIDILRATAAYRRAKNRIDIYKALSSASE
ncbi:MAG TPA: ATP synthase F1 subunit epsilon [candidate division Zixibacteria bacterium]